MLRFMYKKHFIYLLFLLEGYCVFRYESNFLSYLPKIISISHVNAVRNYIAEAVPIIPSLFSSFPKSRTVIALKMLLHVTDNRSAEPYFLIEGDICTVVFQLER